MRHIREPKRPEGARCSAPGFGSGIIVKEGPEQSLVIWDDNNFNVSASSGAAIPNSWFKKLIAQNGETNYHPPVKPHCEACNAELKPSEEEFGFCETCLETTT